jgi:hypothetical protein
VLQLSSDSQVPVDIQVLPGQTTTNQPTQPTNQPPTHLLATSSVKFAGDVYDGTWLYDLRSGRGKFTMKNGTEYDGDWEEDKATG